MDILVILLFLIALPLGICWFLVVFSGKAKSRRAAECQEFALENALDYFPSGSAYLSHIRNSSCTIFKGVENDNLFQVTGSSGPFQAGGQECQSTLVIGDYSYTNQHDPGGAEDRRKYYTQTIFFLSVDSMDLPQFNLYPRGLGGNLATRMSGLKSVEFTSPPAFSKKFILSGTDEPAIRKCFLPAVLDFLATLPEGILLEGAGNSIVLYYKNRLAATAEYSSHKALLEKTARLFMAGQHGNQA